MPKFMRRCRKRHHFYNRVFLLNVLVFLIILVVFATVASRLSFQMEMDRLQQKNREPLAAVCSYYDNKHDEYVNRVYPFYDDRANATSKIIYASSAGFVLLSALLYFLAGLRVSRRVVELETAMDKVGVNNLHHPADAGHDM